MLGWLIIDFVQAAVFHWPLWLALILAQLATLIWGAEVGRWLPAGLLAIGFLWCLTYEVWR